MFWKFLFLVLILFFNFTFLSAQIESGKKTKVKKVKNKTEEKTTKDLSLFIDYNVGKSFRFLKQNTTIFGKELGERKNEKGIISHNFGLGIEQNYSKIFLSIGLSSIKYGEKYQETFSDSLLNYKTNYGYFAVPLQIGFKTKGKFSFAFKTGFQIQFLRKYIKTTVYTLDGEKNEIKDKKSDFINLNSLATVSNLRLSYNINSKLSFYLGTTLVYQLNSTYNKQNYYIHKPYLFSGNAGLLIHF